MVWLYKVHMCLSHKMSINYLVIYYMCTISHTAMDIVTRSEWNIKSSRDPHLAVCFATTLTHWGRATHICVSKLTIIASDNGLSPGRRQAIIWTNAGILLIRTLGINFSEILCEIHSFSFSKMHLKMSSAKWRLFGLGLNELKSSDIGLTLTSCHCARPILIANQSEYRIRIPIREDGVH